MEEVEVLVGVWFVDWVEEFVKGGVEKFGERVV